MQLRQIQYFVAVAEQLNFRKAAEMLYVTQPLLSKQISELEDEVGYPLFIRNTRSVSLTPAGKVMLSEANKLIRQADSLLFSVQNAAKYGNDYGVLHIGYEESYSQAMLLYAESGYGISVLPESFLNYHRQSPITACKMKSVDAELCMAAIWVRDTSCQPRNKLLEICSTRHVDCNLCSKTWCCQNHVGK